MEVIEIGSQEELDEFVRRWTEEIERLKTWNSELADACDDLRAERGGLKRRVAELEAENAGLRADVTARDLEIETLLGENERLAEMMAKGVFIESATMNPEHYDIRTRGVGVMLLAEKLIMVFKASGGENFITNTIEMEFADPKEKERYALTIQKLDGEDSPAQKIERQARRIADLEEALRAVIEGNDLAAERGHSIESWPGSSLRNEARAVLRGDAPKED